MEPTHDANLQSHIHEEAMIHPYTHIPLPNASTHIRLIKLYPAVAFGQGTSCVHQLPNQMQHVSGIDRCTVAICSLVLCLGHQRRDRAPLH